jgi:hypothetical protein
VYAHFFKRGQPSLNWLDPSFAAQRMLSEHPRSTLDTQTLAMVIRKAGGFSFQELNVSLGRVRATLTSGPELSYDFTTRPAYL